MFQQAMNSEKIALYQRIQSFNLDADGALFSHQLAKQNNWSQEFTQQAIEEYKKFVFLACAAGHFVSPSKIVDQVWHLHLTYTHSYWDDFCPNILGKTLHHEPSKGHSEEREKLSKAYQETLKSYTCFFGQCPPKNIWTDKKDRKNLIDLNCFISHSKINLLRQSKIGQISMMALFLIGLSSWAVPAWCNPFNFKSNDFLIFYSLFCVVIVVMAPLLGFMLRSLVQAPNGCIPKLNVYEVAVLAQGEARLIEVALINLIRKDHISIKHDVSKKTMIWQVNTDHLTLSHPIEKAIVRDIQNADGHIECMLAQSYSLIEHTISKQLESYGLLISHQHITKINACFFGSGLLVFAVGTIKIGIGILKDKPVGILIAIMILTIMYIKCLYNNHSLESKRSRFGNNLLKKIEKRKNIVNLPIHYQKEEKFPLQVVIKAALFGTSFLTSSSYAALNHLPAILMMNDRSIEHGINSCSACSASGSPGSSCGGGEGGCGGCGGD